MARILPTETTTITSVWAKRRIPLKRSSPLKLYPQVRILLSRVSNDKGKCHLCGEHFTYDNKPTLDRIDNNKGHQIDNCLLACAECTRLRQRDDDRITRTKIQLKKFCKLHLLPTLITDEKEYYSLRENITGGLSNVLHRVNIRGETLINKLKYDAINNRVISYDTSNVVSHVAGIDFNSLYRSSFSSVKHEFNRYHGGVMYMPGGFIRRFDVYDENGNKNEKVFNTAMNIIHSKKRFDESPDFIFKAEVRNHFDLHIFSFFYCNFTIV